MQPKLFPHPSSNIAKLISVCCCIGMQDCQRTQVSCVCDTSDEGYSSHGAAAQPPSSSPLKHALAWVCEFMRRCTQAKLGIRRSTGLFFLSLVGSLVRRICICAFAGEVRMWPLHWPQEVCVQISAHTIIREHIYKRYVCLYLSAHPHLVCTNTPCGRPSLKLFFPAHTHTHTQVHTCIYACRCAGTTQKAQQRCR